MFRRPLKLMIVLSTCLLLSCINAHAQENPTTKATISPEKRTLILRLLTVMDVKGSAAAVYETMLDQQEKLLPDLVLQSIKDMDGFRRLTPGQQEQLIFTLREDSNRTRNRMKELIAERLDLATVVEEISLDLYDRYFSEAEIKDLIAFYESPTGKKSIDMLPKMMAESAAVTAEKLNPKVLEIILILRQEEQELLKRRIELTKSISPAKVPSKRRTSKRKP